MGATQPFHGIEVEDEGEVGHGTIDRDMLQSPHEGGVEPSGHALIDTARIDEAVAEHNGASAHRGADHLFQMIASGSSEEQRFEARPRMLDRAAQDDVTDCLGSRRAARFARDDDRVPARAQMGGEALDLGRLAGPLAPFECYEEPVHAVLLLRNYLSSAPAAPMNDIRLEPGS